MSIIFGPVYSRRFGKSLGIDLSPNRKQCNFDCLYCELAPAKRVESYDDVVPVDEVTAALEEAMRSHRDIDVITLTANGEPTLYPLLSELIDAIEGIRGETKTLILSNGSTIGEPAVRRSLGKLDMVKLSLDCATDRCLRRLDRAVGGIETASIMRGMLDFRESYPDTPLIIETLFVKSLNDRPEEIAALNDFFLDLRPSRIDIGTIDRPPAYSVEPLSYEALHKISHLFDPSLSVYIASRKKIDSQPDSYSEEEILRTLAKRPLSPEDLSILFDEESRQRLARLQNEGRITVKEENGIKFYILA